MRRQAIVVLGFLAAFIASLAAAPAHAAEGRFTCFTAVYQVYALTSHERCIGEDLVGTQTQHTLYDWTNHHVISQLHGTLVGVTSGTAYTLNYIESGKTAPTFYRFISRCQVRWIAQRGAGNFYVMQTNTIEVHDDDGSSDFVPTYRYFCNQITL